MGLDEIATMPFITRADGTKTLPDGGIDFTETNQVFSVIQSNGAQILYATTWLESQLESILMYYFMGNDELESKKNELFKHEVLESSHFSFQFKKTLLIRIIETLELLEGKEKDKLIKDLKKVSVWRNAFAHGTLEYDGGIDIKQFSISYYSGGKQKIVLNDDFWVTCENLFKDANEAINLILSQLKPRNKAFETISQQIDKLIKKD